MKLDWIELSGGLIASFNRQGAFVGDRFLSHKDIEDLYYGSEDYLTLNERRFQAEDRNIQVLPNP